MGAERLLRVRVVRVVDAEMAGMAAIDTRHFDEVQILRHVLHQHLLNLDARVDEIDDGKVPEGVGHVDGD